MKLYYGAYFDSTDVTPGVVGFVQTAGELLNFHPHVHVLVTDGGFLPAGDASWDLANLLTQTRIRSPATMERWRSRIVE